MIRRFKTDLRQAADKNVLRFRTECNWIAYPNFGLKPLNVDGIFCYLMLSRQEIETILYNELERRKRIAEQVRKHFREVVLEVSSLNPQPEGTRRIAHAKKLDSSARNEYMAALQEFNDFIIHGELPERFKDTSDTSKGT